MKILILTISILILCSCEGLKTLTLHNVSKYESRVTLKPRLENFESEILTADYNIERADSTTIILKPDSSITLLTTFTVLLFNRGIKERDLYMNYLKIENDNDTIVANSKREIISLLKDPKTRFIRRLDKDKVDYNGKNVGTIFIRN